MDHKLAYLYYFNHLPCAKKYINETSFQDKGGCIGNLIEAMDPLSSFILILFLVLFSALKYSKFNNHTH